MCLKRSWSDFDPQAYYPYGEDQNHETSFKGKALQAVVDSWCKIQVLTSFYLTTHEKEKVMFDFIKKTMLTGVGLAAMTRDKIEELAKELTEKGEMTEKEGKELVDELLIKSEKAKRELEAKMESIVKNVLGKLNLATKEDIDEIEERLKRLEGKEVKDK